MLEHLVVGGVCACSDCYVRCCVGNGYSHSDCACHTNLNSCAASNSYPYIRTDTNGDPYSGTKVCEYSYGYSTSAYCNARGYSLRFRYCFGAFFERARRAFDAVQSG